MFGFSAKAKVKNMLKIKWYDLIEAWSFYEYVLYNAEEWHSYFKAGLNNIYGPQVMQTHEAWLWMVIFFFFFTESIWYTIRNLRGSSKGIPALMGVSASPLNKHNVNDVFMEISC